MIQPSAMTPSNWKSAQAAVKLGKVVAFPTDTVYGIGCDAFNIEAIQAIYRLKGRSLNKALPLLLSGPNQLAHVTLAASQSASIVGAHFWPGALTIVLRRNPDLPKELSGDDTIAVRVPDHDQLRAFLAACGGFLAATSANPSGSPDAKTCEEVARYFPSGLAAIIDGGPVLGGQPSTVIDCTTDVPRLLREGAIARDQIEQALGRPVDLGS